MSEDRGVAALLRLMAWMSPAFPVGGFSYSGGLEKAVEDGRVRGAAGLLGWVEVLLCHGSLWNDAIFLAEAWRNGEDAAVLNETADLARALAGSAERYRETVLLGDAFVAAAGAWPHAVLELLPKDVPYPIAVGAVAAGHAGAAHGNDCCLFACRGFAARLGGHPPRGCGTEGWRHHSGRK